MKLQMVGVTGIEDKLQVGVPDTITKLREAGAMVERGCFKKSLRPEHVLSCQAFSFGF